MLDLDPAADVVLWRQAGALQLLGVRLEMPHRAFVLLELLRDAGIGALELGFALDPPGLGRWGERREELLVGLGPVLRGLGRGCRGLLLGVRIGLTLLRRFRRGRIIGRRRLLVLAARDEAPIGIADTGFAAGLVLPLLIVGRAQAFADAGRVLA